METQRSKPSQRRIMAIIGVSFLLGAILAPVPGFSHVGGSVKHLWTKHIKPKADKRFSTHVTVLPADCPSSVGLGPGVGKIADIGSFDKKSGATTVEVTFDGRLRAASVSGNGISFQLRVDDAAGTGRAMALLRASEVGNEGILASFSGLFDGLSKGVHTVSLWAEPSNNGTATGVMWDPGCFDSDKVVITEFK